MRQPTPRRTTRVRCADAYGRWRGHFSPRLQRKPGTYPCACAVFNGASSFNSDLSQWQVEKVKNMLNSAFPVRAFEFSPLSRARPCLCLPSVQHAPKECTTREHGRYPPPCARHTQTHNSITKEQVRCTCIAVFEGSKRSHLTNINPTDWEERWSASPEAEPEGQALVTRSDDFDSDDVEAGRHSNP